MTCSWCGEEGVHAECARAEAEAAGERHEDQAARRRLVVRLERDAARYSSNTFAHLAVLVRRGLA